MLLKRMPWLSPILFVASFLIWLIVLAYVHAKHLQTHIVDEAVHVPQIQFFLQGKFVTHPWLAMIPGYHLLVAGIMHVIGLDSVFAMRVINAIFGLLAGYLFYCIRLSLGDVRAFSHATSFFFLPLLFPYYFLVYTDALSLALVLAALLAMLKRRHFLAALAITISIAVRQNNVIWAAFLATFAAWPVLLESEWRPWKKWREILPIFVAYLLPVAVFLAYWAWNGTIVYSKVIAKYHPDSQLHAGNIYFTLFLIFVFFPCQLVEGVKRLIYAVRERGSLSISVVDFRKTCLKAPVRAGFRRWNRSSPKPLGSSRHGASSTLIFVPLKV